MGETLDWFTLLSYHISADRCTVQCAVQCSATVENMMLHLIYQHLSPTTQHNTTDMLCYNVPVSSTVKD